MQLLTWLKQPKKKSVDLSPTTLSLTSMIMYYITVQRTNTVINMGVNVHGMTRSNDLMEVGDVKSSGDVDLKRER